MNPLFLPGGDKRLSLPGRESERVLAASPAKPALENSYGPERSFTLHPGVAHTEFSQVSVDGGRKGVSTPVRRSCHLHTRTHASLSGEHKEVKDGLLTFMEVMT